MPANKVVLVFNNGVRLSHFFSMADFAELKVCQKILAQLKTHFVTLQLL